MGKEGFLGKLKIVDCVCRQGEEAEKWQGSYWPSAAGGGGILKALGQVCKYTEYWGLGKASMDENLSLIPVGFPTMQEKVEAQWQLELSGWKGGILKIF